MHVGQHSSADKSLLRCKHASFNEYQFLLKELVNRGYNDLQLRDCTEVSIHRQPTKYEISIGNGAIHYTTIALKDLYNPKTGELKNRVKIGGLIYSR